MAKTNQKEQVKTGSNVKERFKVGPPKNYGIFIHNNDLTPFLSVLDVLQKIFSKSRQQAQEIMMYTHQNGKGLVEAPVSKENGSLKINEALIYCQHKDAEGAHFSGMPGRYQLLQFTLEEIE